MAKKSNRASEPAEVSLPPAIVIHGLAHAEAAPSWFRAVVAEARAAHPGVDVTAVLDCGDMPGYALAALRDGAAVIRFSGDTADKIADIAAQCGGRVIAARPETLDLADVERARRDLGRACREWLETHANG
jgi:hypothetical protein